MLLEIWKKVGIDCSAGGIHRFYMIFFEVESKGNDKKALNLSLIDSADCSEPCDRYVSCRWSAFPDMKPSSYLIFLVHLCFRRYFFFFCDPGVILMVAIFFVGQLSVASAIIITPR